MARTDAENHRFRLRTLPMNWKPSFPDFESHLDEVGHIDEEGEESFEAFEEE